MVPGGVRSPHTAVEKPIVTGTVCPGGKTWSCDGVLGAQLTTLGSTTARWAYADDPAWTVTGAVEPEPDRVAGTPTAAPAASRNDTPGYPASVHASTPAL